MGVIFDILGSMVIRVAIVTIILNLMISLHEALYKNTERVYLNETINAPIQSISADIKLAGFRASKAFPKAQRNDLSFNADTDNNGVAEVIRYYIDSTVATNKKLYRTVNGGSLLLIADNITYYRFSYYSVTGATVSGNNISTVKSIFVELTIQSKNTVTSYTGGTSESAATSTKWSQHFFPPNL